MKLTILIYIILFSALSIFSNPIETERISKIKNELNEIDGYVRISLTNKTDIKYAIITWKTEDSVHIRFDNGIISIIPISSISEIEQLYLELRTKDGTFVGKAFTENDSSITLSTNSGVSIIPLKNIIAKSLLISQKKAFCDDCKSTYYRFPIQNPQIGLDSNDTSIGKTNYPVIGTTIGTPGTLNLLIGYNYEKWGVRLSSGMLFLLLDEIGFQLNILRNIIKKDNLEINFSFAPGISKIKIMNKLELDYKYIAALIDMNLNGFFVEAGAGYGDNNLNSKFQILFNLGYVYRFN